MVVRFGGPGPAGSAASRRGPVIGYTRDVVAIFGMQVGQHISIFYYNGLIGWIEMSQVRPYQGRRPSSTCVIEGVDFQQRPIFLIR